VRRRRHSDSESAPCVGVGVQLPASLRSLAPSSESRTETEQSSSVVSLSSEDHSVESVLKSEDYCVQSFSKVYHKS
jgi:hypothetical protein